MEWFQAHRYAILLLFASMLLVMGAYIVTGRSAVSPGTYVSTWGGGGIFVNPISNTLPGTNETPSTPSASGSTHTYVSPFGSKNATSENPDAANNAEFNTLIAELSRPRTKKAAADDTSEVDVYSFIPSGYIGVQNAPASTRTETQESLYAYGNEVGTAIQGYENAHHDPSHVLKNFIEDRSSAEKKASQKQLGADLAAVGKAIERAENVPSQITTAGLALAKSYQEIGSNLAAIPDFERDEDVVSAIEKYNASADRFVQKYVSFSLIFQSYGVTFASYDPGSIFVLQQAPSL